MTLPWAGVVVTAFPFSDWITFGSFDIYKRRWSTPLVFFMDLVLWNLAKSSSNLTSSCWIVPRFGFGF